MSPLAALLLIVGGAAGGVALATERANRVRLVPGKFYRVTGSSSLSTSGVHAPGPSPVAQVAKSLRDDLILRGFADVPIAAAPASLPGTWVFVGAWRGPGESILPARPALPGGLQVKLVEQVPAPYVTPDTMNLGVSVDPGMTQDEAHALAYALRSDNDQSHLFAFGRSFLPDFPTAASLLENKARLLSQAPTRPVGTRDEPFRILADKKSPVLTPEDARRAIFGTIQPGKRVGVLVQQKIKVTTIGSFLDDIGELFLDALDPTGVVREYGKLLDQIWAEYPAIVPTEQKATEAIFKGANVEEAVTKAVTEDVVRAAKVAKVIGPFIAMIPGLGTGVNMALQLGAAIALGEAIDDAAIDAIGGAIPGGPVAQDAFRTGAKVVAATARGKPVDQIALNVLREQLKTYLANAPVPEGTEAFQQLAREAPLVAFDAGIMIAQGKRLQDVGFQVGYRLLSAGVRDCEVTLTNPCRRVPLADAQERERLFRQYQTESIARSRDMLDLMVERELREPLEKKYGQDFVRGNLMPVLRGLLEHQDLVGGDFEQGGYYDQIKAVIACSGPVTQGKAGCLDPAQIPDDLVKTALALVREVPGGALVNWPALVRLVPRAPEEISASLIQEAQRKQAPPTSQTVVTDQARRTGVSHASRTPATGATLPLRLAYEADRADAYVKRRRWVAAYKFVEAGGDMHRITVDAAGSPVVPGTTFAGVQSPESRVQSAAFGGRRRR